MTRFENIGVFVREKVWLNSSPSHTFSCINTRTFSNLVILHSYPPMKMEQTECSETSAYKIQTPGNYPEESIQHSEHDESLKSRIYMTLYGLSHDWNFVDCSPSQTKIPPMFYRGSFPGPKMYSG
jgi:hypothetical protein